MDSLTIREAYTAMYLFLENLYEATSSDDLAGFLGGLSMLENGSTADPAAWQNWLEAVSKAKAGEGDIKLHLR